MPSSRTEGKATGSFKRLLLYIVVAVGGLGFLSFQGGLTPLWQGLYGAGLLALFATLLFTGGDSMPPPPRPGRISMPASLDVSVAAVDDLPTPVHEDEGAAGERAAKLARSRGIDVESEEEVFVESAEELVEVEVEVEADKVHEAEEYIVEVDVESMLQTEIEQTIGQRRAQYGEIRERIERRRRTQLARIRADAAKAFSQFEEREDIAGLLAQPDHGLTVLEEPESPDVGRQYGIVFIRLDETRILRLRVPLDEGFRIAEDPSAKLPGELMRVGDMRQLDLPSVPLPEGLPPPPDLSDLPPPPAAADLPPPPGAVGLPPPPGSADLPPPPGDLPPPPRPKHR